jgi:hypothetical protein
MTSVMYSKVLTYIQFMVCLLIFAGTLKAEQSITLVWDPPDSASNVAGYRLYYGIVSGTYSNWVDVGNVLTGTVPGLVGGVTYYFVATDYDAFGTESIPSLEISYTIPLNPGTNSAPSVTTQPTTGTNLGSTFATLNAAINPNGAATVAWFAYGLTTNYGTISSLITLGATNVFVPISKQITGLLSGTTYHYRLVASNEIGRTFGNDNLLTTLPSTNANPFLLGDANGDGVIDNTELNAVLSNYWSSSLSVYITDSTGLGRTNVQLALTNFSPWNFTVLLSTNMSNWIPLQNTASPKLQFTDPGATNQSPRYYRLRWP